MELFVATAARNHELTTGTHLDVAPLCYTHTGRSGNPFLPAQISQHTDGPLTSGLNGGRPWPITCNSAMRASGEKQSELPRTVTADMADKTPKEPGSGAPYATRIDPSKDPLSPEHMHFIRQVEREQWKKKTVKLRGRNAVTGLAIGALVMGICILANVNASLWNDNSAERCLTLRL
ncbi:cytochrome c oxidase assembly factor 3 homolog, mitochondrial isoform X2 [Paralichthys olivaceus]|uniref:cytochrome c oxidase assembly factor 3 homolog, mitochondrial isoform X2 n=1 Tax=Paralichthys olivaceus TaxID=8255 RepID=UPI00097CF3CC|nr:PREDICTED: uncharacterized protein LOC109643999 isoform X2 [Paralichthys olivaceus]